MSGGEYNHRWENDIDAGPLDPLRSEFAVRTMFETLKRQGVKPEQLFDKTLSAEYATWLCEPGSESRGPEHIRPQSGEDS